MVAAMCILPFIQPRHLPPLGAFYDEWLAFALGTAATALFGFSRKGLKATLPLPALFLLLFALALLGRTFLSQPAYLQSGVVWAIYATFASAMVLLGRGLAGELGRDKVCEVLAVSILAGALLNAACAALQIGGIPRFLSSFVAHLQGDRATGNIGQANLYANYLALGGASLVFLYARGRLGAAAALTCGFALVVAAALAASRASFLYASGFGLLGLLVLRRRPSDALVARLGRSACALGAGVVAAQLIVPIGLAAFGHRSEGAVFTHALQGGDGVTSDDLRLSAWALAWRLFVAAPWFGAGPDEFPGAAFAFGLPVELASGQLWASPHNMLLHLASETGLVGVACVLAALLSWAVSAGREFFRTRDPAMWWLVACVGIELVHALLEYPMWYAHFLALTCVLMGISAGGASTMRPAIFRAVTGIGVVIAVGLLAVTMRAYFRFDLASPVAAGRSLAPDANIARDRATLHELGASLLAPRAETWLFLSYPLDGSEVEEKVEVGRRVMRVWPAREVVCRQAIFLALAKHDEEAVSLLRSALRTFPRQRIMFIRMIASAPDSARHTLRGALEEPPR